jgi:hypothetical protein
MNTLEPCNVALKEWDAQVQALATGQVGLVLRKGGIIETRDEFSVEHTRFWLYPTFLHENLGELRMPFHELLRRDPSPGNVALGALATVERVWKIETLEGALKLEPLQALTADTIERRFAYRNRPWLHALLLRVHACSPVMLEEHSGYAGCVSWVPLEASVTPAQTKPALSDAEFTRLSREIELLLDR